MSIHNHKTACLGNGRISVAGRGLLLGAIVGGLLASAGLAFDRNLEWEDALNTRYQQTIQIQYNGTVPLTNYQVEVIVDTATPIAAGHMRADAQDVWMVSADKYTLLNYYIEPLTLNTTQTRIWVKMPLLPPNCVTNVLLRYGNATAVSSKARGLDTFNTFEDFDGSGLETDGTVFSDGRWQWLNANGAGHYLYFLSTFTRPGWCRVMTRGVTGDEAWNFDQGPTFCRSFANRLDYITEIRVDAAQAALPYNFSIVTTSYTNAPAIENARIPLLGGNKDGVYTVTSNVVNYLFNGSIHYWRIRREPFDEELTNRVYRPMLRVACEVSADGTTWMSYGTQLTMFAQSYWGLGLSPKGYEAITNIVDWDYYRERENAAVLPLASAGAEVDTGADPLVGGFVSGRITDANTGQGLDGIQIMLSSWGELVTTNGGYYSARLYGDQTVTVTPVCGPRTFEPASRSYVHIFGDQVHQDFTINMTQSVSRTTNCLFRRTILVQNTNNFDMTDYQVLIPFDMENSRVCPDGRDIRFPWRTDETPCYSIELLNYWINPDTLGTSNAELWVKVPLLKARQTTELTMEYGDWNAAPMADGSATFRFFDDFSGATIDEQKWQSSNLSGWRISEGRLQGTNTSGYLCSRNSTWYDSLNDTLEVKATVRSPALHGHSVCGALGDGVYGYRWLSPDYVTYTNMTRLVRVADWSDFLWTTVIDTYPVLAEQDYYSVRNGMYTAGPILPVGEYFMSLAPMELGWIDYTGVGVVSYSRCAVYDYGTKQLVRAQSNLLMDKCHRVALGGDAGEPYDADWDWVRVRRSYCGIPAPAVTIGPETPKAQAVAIAGRVLYGTQGVPGIRVHATDSFSVMTDAGGCYTNHVWPGWSGTVSPTNYACGYYSPAARNYTDVQSLQGGQNFSLLGVAPPGAFALEAPADGADVVDQAELRWTSASCAVAYDVYLGASANPALVGTITGCVWSFAITKAEDLQWYVVARNIAGTRRIPASGTQAFYAYKRFALTGQVTIAENNFNYDGMEIVHSGGTLTIAGAHRFAYLTLTNGAVLTHPATTTGRVNSLDLTVTRILSISSDSQIDVSGRGYPRGYTHPNTTVGASQGNAGGSYGGLGGTAGGTPNARYGDYKNPNEPGSGSGMGAIYGNHAGGGLVRISARDMILAGAIRANGLPGKYARGSGGGVYLNVGTLTGGGLVEACGGNGTLGGGGGGRIALYYDELLNFIPTNQLTAGGGLADFVTQNGQAGTVYIRKNGEEGQLVQGDKQGAANIGRVNSQQTAESRTSYFRDPMGRVTSLVFEVFGAFTVTNDYEWGPEGQLRAWTDARRRHYALNYDAAGRLAELEIPGLGSVTWQGYTWDQALRPRPALARRGVAWTDWEQKMTAASAAAAMLPPWGRPADWRGWDWAQALRMGEWRPWAPLAGYDDLALETELLACEREAPTVAAALGLTLPGGATVAYGYDAWGRLNAVTAKGPSGNEVFTETRQYNLADRVVARAIGGVEQSFAYDTHGRLLTAMGLPMGNEAYTYDAQGNRRTAAWATNTWSYGPDNELLAYGDASAAYDAAGRLIRISSSGGSNVFIYDQAGRLVQALDGAGNERAAYGYDAVGRLLWKRSNGQRTWFVRDEGGVIAEYSETGQELRSYGRVAGGMPPLFVAEQGTYYWQIADAQGTPRRLLHPSGQVVWSADWSAFGEAAVALSNVSNLFGFAGFEYDPETGLLYDGRRFYEPRTGRYLTPDAEEQRRGEPGYVLAGQDPFRARAATPAYGAGASLSPHAAFPAILARGWGSEPNYQRDRNTEGPGLLASWGQGVPNPFANLERPPVPLCIGGSGGACQDGSGDGTEMGSEEIGVICAQVTIEIKQQLTLERQAFEAHMKINNAMPEQALDNVKVEVTFADAQGNTVIGSSNPNQTNAAFFIRVDRKDKVTAVDGTGRVAANTAANIYWLIIPSPGIGGQDPRGQMYYVGAKLTYKIAGEEYVTEVSPDYIYVKPMPELRLDYFLPSLVYGDDAFTPEIEPPVPFPLGVRVQNNGYGYARKLQIESAQPRIIENRQGLLVGFEITGSEVNGNAASKSLTVDFGDVAPERAAIAHWAMECTLSGEFISFDASFTHSDELGGELTSLLEGVYTHELVREVQVDLPGRDGIRDFLARDNDILRVYESDSVDAVVEDMTSRSTLELRSQNGLEWMYVLTVPESNAMFLASAPLTVELVAPYLEVKSAVRVDGKMIKPANVWISKWRQEGGAPWKYDLNLFDVERGGQYVITLAKQVPAGNVAPVLAYIGNKVGTENTQLGFMLRASDLNDDPVLILSTNLPFGASLTNTSSGLAEFWWDVSAGAWGIYDVTFRAHDGQLYDSEAIKIYVGHQGDALNSNGIPNSLVGYGRAPLNPGPLQFECGPTNLVIHWQASPDLVGDLLAYRIYWDSATGIVQLAEVPAAITTYAWAGLAPGTSYPVRITSYDQEGMESHGATGIGATWVAHPTNVAAMVYSKQVDLTWAPACPAALIQRYQVYASVAPFTNISQMTPVALPGGTSTIATVKNLIDGQTYHFAVAAANLSGCLDPSVTTITATPQPDVTGPELLTVRWGADLLTNGMVCARTNTITLSATDRSGVDWALFRVDGQNVCTAVAPAALAYHWDVAAMADGMHTVSYQLYDKLGNVAGYSNEVMVQLAAPDTRPVFIAPGNRSYTNSAVLPVLGRAYASSELLFTINGLAVTNRAWAGQDGMFTVLLPLVEGVNVIRATPFNRGGDGPESDPLTVTWDTTAPIAPLGIAAQALEQGQVVVSWMAPDDLTILGYNLYRSSQPFTSVAQATRVNSALYLDTKFYDLPAADGFYYYRATRVILSGAESAPSELAMAQADRTAPRVRSVKYTPQGLFDPISGSYGPGVVEVALTMSERLQGQPYLAVSRTNGYPLTVTLAQLDETNYAGSFTIEASTPSGSGYLLFSGRDRAGNRGTEIDGAAQIYIDTDGPAVTVLALQPGEPIENLQEYPAHITVVAQLSEDVKHGTAPMLSYQFSGRTNQGLVADLALTGIRTWSGVIDLPPQAGIPPESMTFALSAVDALGNLGTTINGQKSFQVYQGDLPALDSPLGLTAKAQAGGRVLLSWRTVAGAADYQVYRQAPGATSLTPLARAAGVLSYVDAPTVEGIYQYAVAAVREANGQESLGAPCSPVPVVSDATAPNAPSNVRLELTGKGVLVEWEAPAYTEPVTYSLYRAGGTEILSVSGLTARTVGWAETSLIDPKPSQSEHVYTVTAVDSVGNESAPAVSAYLNFRLLPVDTLEVKVSRGTLPQVSWTHPYPLELAGYDFYLGRSNEAFKINSSLIRSSTYIDTGYTGNERDYTVVAVDKQLERSQPRALKLPMVWASLKPGERLDRGIMNRLTYVVSNQTAEVISNVQLQVGFAQQTNRSEVFEISAFTNREVDVVMGGLTNLPNVGALACQVQIRPNAGELVTLSDGQVLETGSHQLPFELRAGVFTRGGAGTVEAVLYNDSEEDIEVITATSYGNKPSGDVRVKLMDRDGNIYAATPCFQATGSNVVALVAGDVVARVAPGGSFAFAPITLLVPTNVPDNLEVKMELDNLYWHRGQPDETKVNGLVMRAPVTLTNTPYYAMVQNVTPALSRGERDILITGQAFSRLTQQPATGVTVNLTVSWHGFELIEALETDANGYFSYAFRPLSGISGTYRVWAQHPDMRTKATQAEFTIARISLEYSSYQLRIPTDFDQVVKTKVLAGAGTTGTNLRWEYLAEDQPGGQFSQALDITPGAPINLLPGAQGELSFTVRGRSNTTGSLVLRLVSDETGTNAWLKLPVEYAFAEAKPTIYSTPSYVQTGVAQSNLVTETLTLENRGLAELHGLRLAITGEGGSPVPGWVQLSSESAHPNMAVGEKRQVSVTFAPGGSVADGHYTFFLRVSGSNLPPANIGLYVAVTRSGKGGAQFKVSDMYTGTLKQGQLVQGLAGAQVRIQHTQVTSIDQTRTTDNLGEALFADLPVGTYNYRVSASGCDPQGGAFEVKPGQTALIETHMLNQLVRVEWEVRPITIEDRYEIVLNATYATDVPAAVVEMFPASITLPSEMAVQGRTYCGQIQLRNRGLVRADNVYISIPAANEYFVYAAATDDDVNRFRRENPDLGYTSGKDLSDYWHTNGIAMTSVEAGQSEVILIWVMCRKGFDGVSGSGGALCTPISASYNGSYNYKCANGKTSGGSCGTVVSYSISGGCGGSSSGGGSSVIYGSRDGPGTGTGGGWSGGGWVSDCGGDGGPGGGPGDPPCPPVCPTASGKVCPCKAYSGALTCPKCPGDKCPTCPGDTCPECDNDGNGSKESCKTCDLNFDGKPDACAQFDCDGDGKKEACFKLDLVYPPWDEDKYNAFVGLNPKTKINAPTPLANDDGNLVEVRLDFPNRPPTGTVKIEFSSADKVRAWKNRKKTEPAQLTWTLPAAFPQKIYLEGVGEGSVMAIASYDGTTAVCPDVMNVIVARAAIYPDYDQSRTIDETDFVQASSGRVYRFWVNDDNDLEVDKVTKGFDAPVYEDQDAQNDHVDSERDLIDFFPLAIDVRDLLFMFDKSLFKVMVNPSTVCVNYLEPEFSPERAGYHLTDAKSGERLANAKVKPLVGEDRFLTPTFQDRILGGRNIWLLEASQEAFNKYIELLVMSKSTDQILFQWTLPVRISSVEDMYRFKNLLSASSCPDEGYPDRLYMPPNRPDDETDGRSLVQVHGYGCNPDGTRGAICEFFKRLYWSGMKSKFYSVSWWGYDSQLGEGPTPEFYCNVRHAFETAPALKNFLSTIGGDITVIAHSLGNMLVSSAIQDYDAPVTRYFLLNAAVAKETYDANAPYDLEGMTMPSWNGLDPRLYAANWYKLFPGTDKRSTLTWRGRFSKVAPLASCYHSSDEDVFRRRVGNPNTWGLPVNLETVMYFGRYAWVFQEKTKGKNAILNGLFGSTYGGWGMEYPENVLTPPVTAKQADYYTQLNDEYWVRKSEAQLNATPVEVLRRNPFFKHDGLNNTMDLNENTLYHPAVGAGTPGSEFVTPEHRGRMLAEMIPALTEAAGLEAVDAFNWAGEGNYDMPRLFQKDWAPKRLKSAHGSDWRHCDFEHLAYLYVFRLYDHFVQNQKRGATRKGRLEVGFADLPSSVNDAEGGTVVVQPVGRRRGSGDGAERQQVMVNMTLDASNGVVKVSYPAFLEAWTDYTNGTRLPNPIVYTLPGQALPQFFYLAGLKPDRTGVIKATYEGPDEVAPDQVQVRTIAGFTPFYKLIENEVPMNPVEEGGTNYYQTLGGVRLRLSAGITADGKITWAASGGKFYNSFSNNAHAYTPEEVSESDHWSVYWQPPTEADQNYTVVMTVTAGGEDTITEAEFHTRTLRRTTPNQKGDDVLMLQSILHLLGYEEVAYSEWANTNCPNKRGYKGEVTRDGDFGPATGRALWRFLARDRFFAIYKMTKKPGESPPPADDAPLFLDTTRLKQLVDEHWNKCYVPAYDRYPNKPVLSLDTVSALDVQNWAETAQGILGEYLNNERITAMSGLTDANLARKNLMFAWIKYESGGNQWGLNGKPFRILVGAGDKGDPGPGSVGFSQYWNYYRWDTKAEPRIDLNLYDPAESVQAMARHGDNQMDKYWNNYTDPSQFGTGENYLFRTKKQYPANANIRVTKRDGVDCLDANGWYNDDDYDTLLKCIAAYNGSAFDSYKDENGRWQTYKYTTPERFQKVDYHEKDGLAIYIAKVMSKATGWKKRAWTWSIRCKKTGSPDRILDVEYGVMDYAGQKTWLQKVQQALNENKATNNTWQGYSLPTISTTF